jgi:hypothetical protein
VEYDIFQVLFLLQPIGVILALMGMEDASVSMIHLTAVLSVLSYLGFSVALIYDMTTFLGIRAFKLPANKKD